jgi:hypothetical protein
LVRFALSEHFLNVDQLLSQLQGRGPAPVKKKRIGGPKPETAATEPPQSQPVRDYKPPVLNDLQSIKDNWQGLLDIIGDKLGAGTRVLLKSAVPTKFEGGLLTLSLSQAGEVSKQMLERNGRAEQIATLLSERCGSEVKLDLQIASGPEGESAIERPTTPGRKRNDLINDPGVKAVITGLDATITGIEEE